MEPVLLAVAATLPFAIAAATALFAFKLMRQHGRILIRLEALERAAGMAREAPAAPGGLAVGSEFPSFRLPDVVGRATELASLRGRRVLLVSWSPSCGFCDRVAAELATVAPQLRAANVEAVLVSAGDVDANREMFERHGLDGRLLLTDGSEPIRPFAGLGTPVAYLLDEDGRVAEPLAIGADGVIALVGQASRDAARPTTPTRSPTLAPTDAPMAG